MGSQSSISVDLPQYRSSHKSRFLAVKAKEKTVFWRGICIGIACTLFLVGGFYLAKRMENNSGTAMAPTYNLDRTVHQVSFLDIQRNVSNQANGSVFSHRDRSIYHCNHG
jgi:hypothetical protein